MKMSRAGLRRLMVVSLTAGTAIIAAIAWESLKAGSPSRACLVTDIGTTAFMTTGQRANLRVSFVEQATAAAVRVALVDDPMTADVALADDATEPMHCNAETAVRRVAVTDRADAVDATIMLTDAAQADYRIYLRSDWVSPKEAAALVVASARQSRRLATR